MTCVNALSKPSWPEHLGGKRPKASGLTASSAVRWLQRWRDSGSTRAKLSGGSTSPLEEVEWLLALVAERRRVDTVTHQDASASRLYVDAATRRLNATEHASTWSRRSVNGASPQVVNRT